MSVNGIRVQIRVRYSERNTQFTDIYMFQQNENDTSSNFKNRISFETILIFLLHFI